MASGNQHHPKDLTTRQRQRPTLSESQFHSILTHDIARRFKRITNQPVAVSPMFHNRAERKAILREWAQLPSCKLTGETRRCIQCRVRHLRELTSADTHTRRHTCPFGRTCLFMPLMMNGACIAIWAVG